MAKILIVEDDPDNRQIFSNLLQHHKYEVIEAVDGDEGLKKALTELPDLILLDMSLPGLNGWEVAKKLRATPKLEKVPIVALTAHATAEDEKLARESGCNAYITKPCEPNEVIKTIKKFLE